MGLVDAEGREAEADVLQHFDEHAAQAEHDRRAEHRIVHHAEHGFDAAAHHFADQHAVDLRVRRAIRGAVQQGPGALGDRGIALDIQQNAADLRLVQDIGRDDLERAGPAERSGRRDRRFRRRRQALPHRRYPGAGQDRLGFVLAHRPGRRGQHPGRRGRRRAFAAAVERLAETGQRRHRPDRQRRILVHRIAEFLVHLHDIPAADQAHDHRLAGIAFAHRAEQAGAGLLHERCGRHGCHEDDVAVVVRLVDRQADILHHQVRVVQRLGGEIDRVVGAGERDHGLQFLLDRRRQGRDLQPVAYRVVRHLHADPAGDGLQADPAALGIAAVLAGIGDIDQFFRRAGPVDAVLPEQGVVDRVAAGEAGSVAGSRPGADIGRAYLHENDRLARIPRLAQRLPQPGGVADPFGIDDDDFDTGRFGVEIDHFADIDVAFVAGRHPVIGADAALLRHQQDMGAVGAALADDAGRPRRPVDHGRRVGEGAEPGFVEGEDAEAVRPDDTHAAVPRDLRDGLLRPLAVRALLGEAGGEDDGGLHARLGAIAQRIDGNRRRHGDQGAIDRLWHVADRRKGGEALDGLAPRVDRVDPPAIAHRLHRVDRPAADARRRIGRTDHRHGFRAQDRQQGSGSGPGRRIGHGLPDGGNRRTAKGKYFRITA